MNDILIGKIISGGQLQGSLQETKNMSGSFNLFELPEYQYAGAYTVTPSSSTQTLKTTNMTLLGDITINPIPSNYGLITWNGTSLTVS